MQFNPRQPVASIRGLTRICIDALSHGNGACVTLMVDHDPPPGGVRGGWTPCRDAGGVGLRTHRTGDGEPDGKLAEGALRALRRSATTHRYLRRFSK